jgi:hypothetical protein
LVRILIKSVRVSKIHKLASNLTLICVYV